MTAVINLLDFILPATIVVTDQTAKALQAGGLFNQHSLTGGNTHEQLILESIL